MSVVGALKSAATAVKKSPSTIRKKLNHSHHPKVGTSREYSSLEDCKDNGWLHSDDAIRMGIDYNLKYLGSAEIDYVPGNPQENNALALKTIRYVKRITKGHGQTYVLHISAGRISLTTGDGQKLVMRHSTSRIAYSTVDHEHPKYFCYVALPRASSMPLCHIFYTKGAKVSYELTFTCAQAFDTNYKTWIANKDIAKIKSNASESGDVEPNRAVKSPLVQRKSFVMKQTSPLNNAQSKSNSSSNQPAPTTSNSPQQSPPKAKQSSAESSSQLELPSAESDRSESQSSSYGFGDEDGEEEEVDLRASVIPHELLEVENESDEHEIDNILNSLSLGKSNPNLLEIGIKPETYNGLKDEYIDVESDED